MRNANKLLLVLWMLFPLVSTAQVQPPITRSVLTTNIPAFGSAGQALFRISIPPYLNWSNVVASGGLSITESNNIINLASNYTYAVSNLVATGTNNSGYIFSMTGKGTNTTFYGIVTVNSNVSPVMVDFQTNIPTPPWSEGRVFYDTNSHTLCFYPDKTNVTVNISQEQHVRVYNGYGVTITNGSVLTIDGSHGQLPVAIWAQALTNQNITNFTCVGVATEDIPSHEEGLITSIGIVHGLDTHLFSAGDMIYVSTNAGAFTATKPGDSYAITKIGIVLVSHPVDGSIFVSPRQALFWENITGITNIIDSVKNSLSNYTYAVSNLVVASTNGQFIEKTGGVGTNTTIRQVNQTGPALTIGTNAGAVFSIMGLTNNGPGYLIQAGSGQLAPDLGGTNAFLLGTNANATFRGTVGISNGANITCDAYPSVPLKIYAPLNSLTNIVEIYKTNGAMVWRINQYGDLVPGADAVQNIGTSSIRISALYGAGAISGSSISGSSFVNANTYVMARSAVYGSTLIITNTATVSNLVLSSVRWVDSPVQLFWAATGPTAPNATPVVPGSQILGSGFSVGGIGTEKVYGSFQVNHNVCASNATVYTEHHLHVSPTNAPSAGSSNIAFTIVYDWANVGGTRFGPYTNTVQIGLTSQTYNNLIEFGHQTNFFPGISAMSRCTIYRTAAASNEYNATVILDGVDVHYPIDRLGSASDTAP